MSATQTLTMRIEAILDRWNKLQRAPRERLAGQMVAASMQLGELARVHRELTSDVERLERIIDDLEKSSSSATPV